MKRKEKKRKEKKRKEKKGKEKDNIDLYFILRVFNYSPKKLLKPPTNNLLSEKKSQNRFLLSFSFLSPLSQPFPFPSISIWKQNCTNIALL